MSDRCDHEWIEVGRHTIGSRTYIKYECQMCGEFDIKTEYE